MRNSPRSHRRPNVKSQKGIYLQYVKRVKRGFNALDTASYKCNRSGRKYGHLLFDPQQIKNHKFREDPITCRDCRTREKAIIRKLNSAGAWRCTCRSLLGHSEKCKLYPKRIGERRWPGQNKGVTEEDWLFVEPRMPIAWKKQKRS